MLARYEVAVHANERDTNRHFQQDFSDEVSASAGVLTQSYVTASVDGNLEDIIADRLNPNNLQH